MNKKKNKTDKTSNEQVDKNEKVNKAKQEEKTEELSIKEKLEDAENRVLRTLAETENLRKR